MQLRVYESKILRRIFGHKRDVLGVLRRVYNEKINSLCRSPNIFRMIKSRRLRWTGFEPEWNTVGLLSGF